MTDRVTTVRWLATGVLALGLLGCQGDAPPEADIAKVAQALQEEYEGLPGSMFEIDDDANLIVDHVPMDDWLDWANVMATVSDDAPTGQNDNSYAGGSKEDDACPATTTGSIPNNKSDLLEFGTWVEPGDPGFLHLFWSRVQEPSGTTLMDFELNQSTTDCGNGVNPVRTEGDLLIEYRLEQGGARATILVRTWNGMAWGPAEDLTAVDKATGTINSSPIPAAGELGPYDPRTFGEASLDLSYVFKEGKCTSFASAFLKSRASDSFTSQLKDYIAPVPVNISNCGQVIIRKVTDPADTSETAPSFGFTHNLATDPPQSTTTFLLKHGQNKTFTNVLFGTGYTVTEDVLASGFELLSINCAASTGVTPTVDLASGTVTFDIDDDADIVDCTYTNRARGKIIVEKVTSDGYGAFNFTSGTLTPPAFTLTTTAAGLAGKDARTFDNLVPGTYDVAETVPAGWNLTSATCSDGSPVNSIVVAAGETVTCTFTNARERGAIKIVKTRKHAALGAGDKPHAGVSFTITGGELPAAGVTVVTNASGVACVENLVLSSFVGAYTVTETVPAGYAVTTLNPQVIEVSAEGSCASGPWATATFANMPLTNITVSVNSQVDGGTASTINCVLDSAVTGPNGDGSLTLSNKLPGTYVCTIVVDP